MRLVAVREALANYRYRFRWQPSDVYSGAHISITYAGSQCVPSRG